MGVEKEEQVSYQTPLDMVLTFRFPRENGLYPSLGRQLDYSRKRHDDALKLMEVKYFTIPVGETNLASLPLSSWLTVSVFSFR